MEVDAFPCQLHAPHRKLFVVIHALIFFLCVVLYVHNNITSLMFAGYRGPVVLDFSTGSVSLQPFGNISSATCVNDSNRKRSDDLLVGRDAEARVSAKRPWRPLPDSTSHHTYFVELMLTYTVWMFAYVCIFER